MATDAQVCSFAEKKGFSGTLFAKGDVNGPNARPTYRYVIDQTGMSIGWNFKGKFLVDAEGNVMATSNPIKDVAPLIAKAPPRSEL